MDAILGLIGTFGYGVVFLIVMSESAGLPVPGETSLLIAAALAATGQLNIFGVIAAAAAAAILGDTGGYWVGRKYGVALLRRYGKVLRFEEDKFQKAEAFFAKHGEKTVFLGRFVPVGRIFSAVLAGIGKMNYPRFLAWNATGGIVWATLMGTLGYVFGHNLRMIEQIVQRGGFALLFAIILFLAGRYVFMHRAQLRERFRSAALVKRFEAVVERIAPLPVLRVGRWTWGPAELLGGALIVLALGVAGVLVVALT